MTTDTPKEEPALIPESELDETNILSSLARLQVMHASLRQLRETVPRVMDSVLIDSPAPDQLHSHFSQAAIGAAKDIKSFAQLMEQSKSKEVLKKAKESRANDAEGITAWKVSEHADWLDVKKDDTSDGDDRGTNDEDVDDVAVDTTVEGMQATLENFKESHADIEALLDRDTETIKLVLPSPTRIHFEIKAAASTEGQGNYSVQSVGEKPLHKKIVDALAPRSKSIGLNILLEMLVSYKDIMSRPCVKCYRLLDPNAQFPVVRSRKRMQQADGQFSNQWDALHLSCD